MATTVKKILILTNLDIGLYNFRGEVLRALIEEGYELHIGLPDGEMIPKLVQMGCVFHETELERRGTNPLEELKLIKKYGELIDEVKPDLGLTYTIKPNIYGGMAFGRRGIPFITNITGLGTAVEGNGALQVFTQALYRIAMKKVSCLFFQNKYNARYFRSRKIGVGKHTLLPGSGVNLEKFSYIEFPKESEPISFLFISRVMREKGIDQFLEMAKVIHKEYPETEFHILGFCEDDDKEPDSYRNKIRALEEEGIVKFEGMQEDVRPFLAKSQCTIHPSFYPEGMSNVCLESAASGRPVITTDRPGCAETVTDGITGFLVEPEDSIDLILKVREFLSLSYEDRRQMGIDARQKMEREFDRNIVVRKYVKITKKLLG